MLENSPGVYTNKHQASAVIVKGHSSQHWENSPAVSRNKPQASTVTVKS